MAKIEAKYIGPEEIKTLNRVSKDPFFFSLFCYVINPVLGRVQFNLYPFQKAVLLNFLKNRFNIILKFRQAGITELISMFCLWLTMFHPNKKVNIISIKDTTAKKVLKKIKFMYKNLPWFLQTPIINGRAGEFGSASMIEFSNGSFIESIPTSEQAGRSESLSLLVIDEAAIVKWASVIWASSFPTLSCAIGTTPIFKRVYQKTKGKHLKAVTEVIQLKDICPCKKGQIDISSLGIYTLTHTGQWGHVTHSQNKGELETWYVKDSHGKIGGYTPAHRLFTTSGWKTVKEIIEEGLNIISVDTKVDNFVDVEPTKPPKVEKIKPILGFPEYYISNFGKVYKDSKRKGFVELKPRPNKDGYLRVGLTKPGVLRESGDKANRAKSKIFQRSVHSLVAEAFIGPKGNYQVDHIDNIRTNNTVNNLRYITASDNVSKSYTGVNLNALLVSISHDKLPELLKRGKILEMAQNGLPAYQIAKEVYPDKKQGSKFIRRILKDRQGRVYISKLQLVKVTKEDIYDIHVEGDESYITANNFVNHNTGGSAILNSTPYGSGNFFHNMWVDALSGGNPFNPIRLHWQMHPDRDQAWYDQMKAALGPRRTAQEIDGDFLSSGNTVFDMADIRDIEESLVDYPPLRTAFNSQYMEFDEVDPNKEYFIGADVATGRSLDYSSFTVMDKEGEEAAVYKGRIPISRYGKLLGDTGIHFNEAVIAPESNDIGIAVTMYLQTEGYPKLYHSTKLLKKKHKNKPEEEKVPGWLTTSKNRSVIINGLEEDIRNGNVIIKDPFFVNEAPTFIYDAGGIPMAKGKRNRSAVEDIDMENQTYTDDDIMGKAITNHIRKSNGNNIIILPQ